MKKFLLMLAASLSIALAACGGDTGTAPPPAQEPAAQAETPAADTAVPPADTSPAEADTGNTIMIHVVLVGDNPNDEENVLAAVNAKLAADGYNFGVRTTYIHDYWTQLALMVAGGDVVDVAWAHVSTLADLAGRGVYQPFGNIFDEAVPDFAARLPQAARLQGTVRGDLYAIPRLVPMAQFNWVWNIRRDLREEWGFSEITTLEQLEAYFLRSLEEGMIPTSDHNSQPLYPVFANYFFPMGDGGNHPIYVDPTDPNFTVRSFWDSDSWRNVADTKVRWRDMGIIAEDESRITGAHQGFVSGIVAGIPSNTNSEIERIDEMKSMMPDAYIETVLLNPGTLRQYIGGDNMLSVGSTSSNVREAVQFIAWIRSNQENFDLWSFGVAGVNHNLTSDGAVTHEGIADNMRYIPNTWMWNDIDLVRFPAAVPAEHINRLRNWDNNAEVTPFIGFVIDASQFSSEFAQVNAVSSEYYQMMTAGLVNLEDIIDELMSQLEAAGLQTLIDGVQAQLNEFLGV